MGSNEARISYLLRSPNRLVGSHMMSAGKSSARVILRLADPEFSALKKTVFKRYPRWEWATFARFGWRETADSLVISLTSLDLPEIGDLNESVGHVAIDEKYSLRVALTA